MDIPNSKALQTRLYFIMDKLQDLSKELPENFQQRISSELLSGLANTLLHNTLFEIVRGLKDIQQATERNLFHDRIAYKDKLRQERGAFYVKNKKRMSEEKLNEKFAQVRKLQYYKMRDFDRKIILRIDEKVSEQQMFLEKAGVPGFYVTTNPFEVQIQTYLLKFILKISEMNLPPIPSLDTESAF